MRTPVVAYRTGGVPEVIRDGQSGLLVERGDIKGLTDGAISLLTDPNLSERLGKEGRDFVKENFSINELTRRYMTLYNETVSR
jgi:glycosyltransferase involved in cell wall biosynthesis